jgi:polyphosphate kinase
MLFKVDRDADFSVDEKRDEDFIEAMEEVLEDRERSRAVRMVYSPGSSRLRDELARRLSLEDDDLYGVDGPVNPGALHELTGAAGFDRLREKPWKIYPSAAFHEEESFWDRISRGDVMIRLPYQSFDPVVRFFQDAAADPQVISIKTALYRTSGNSPVVRALEQAALNGKHVTALVELKARFDEERNISWANRLEKAGVIVVYGLARLKVHAKITMVLRREADRIKRYVHLSTGNYNDKTARLYEDIGVFTCREDIAFDGGLLFNMITGYSVIQPMRRLVIAPAGLKRRLLELIDRETKRSNQEYPGKIMAKINALSDTDIIDALYRASRAGVKVFLCVRGICTLVPGMPGLSENIRVISVIDRYLEHSRICYFANGGAEEIFLSSADWMPRNLERRVELMFPVLQDDLRSRLKDTLEAYFRDNCHARLLGVNGEWTPLNPAFGEAPFRVQEYLLAQAAAEHPEAARTEFVVRRSPPSP